MAHSNILAGIEAFSNPSDPMSADRRRSLNSLLPDLAPNVLVDNFITRLHREAGGFLSDREIEAIRSQTDRCKSVEELVVIMKGKDNASFDTFCRVLESVGYGHWAKRLMSKAGIQCEGMKDSLSLPLDELNDILRSKKVLFVPLQKKLHSEFVDLTAKFEGYVFGLGPVKFRVFRRHCSGFIQAQRSGPLGPMPDLPHEIGPLLDMLNREWNFIDIRLLCDLVERSDESQLNEHLISYKKALEEFSQQKLSELEKCVQIIHDSSLGDIEDGAILAAILSKDPTLKEIFKIKDFLIGCLHLEKAKFLGFDSGCTVLFFSIARGIGGNPQHLATSVLTNIHVFKEFAVCRVLLLGSWAVEVSSATLHRLKSVCIPDSEKEQSVRKEDFDDIVEEVRNLKDQVVSLKLQMWQLNQEKLTTDLDRDIALDSSSNHVESKSEKLPAEQKSVLSLFRRILPKRKKKTSSPPVSPKVDTSTLEQLLADSMEITSLEREPYVISGPRPFQRHLSISGHSIGNRSQDSGSCSLYSRGHSRGGSHGYSGEDLYHRFPPSISYYRPPSTKSCN